MQPCRLRLEVAFRKLSLQLRGHKGAHVLADVSGGFKAARVTAIMGPSGAGRHVPGFVWSTTWYCCRVYFDWSTFKSKLHAVSDNVAGKTSLLSALAGKASYGTVTKECIYINGRRDCLERYHKEGPFTEASVADCFLSSRTHALCSGVHGCGPSE